MILLSLGITLVGVFLSGKLAISSTARYKRSPVQPLSQPSNSGQFAHVLVPGGKDAEEFHSRTIPEAPTVPPNIFKPLFSAIEDTGTKPDRHVLTTSKPVFTQAFRSLSGPPDQLEPRIDAFSFNCQECKRAINLSWEKVKKAMGNDQLQVDCPHCHRQYPFDYERAERKTLSITFSGIIRQDENTGDTVSIPSSEEASKTFEDKETQAEKRGERPIWNPAIPAAEPVQAIVNTTPSDSSDKSRFAGFAENRVGEAARAIRDSSKSLVGSFANNRFFQTMTARLQPTTSGSWALGEESGGGKFTHVLVPGGKEGESLSQLIPGTMSQTAALAVSVNLNQSHGTFEDMSNADEPAQEPIGQPAPTAPEVSVLVLPDRLSIHIDTFSFNCQNCEGAVNLPWARVEAGPATPQFQVDCPSCHHQYPFNYEQAKRKTLKLVIKPFVESQLEDPKKSPDPDPIPVQESVLVQEPKQVQDSKPVQQEPKPVLEETKEEKRTSPGMEYDRAILERG